MRPRMFSSGTQKPGHAELGQGPPLLTPGVVRRRLGVVLGGPERAAQCLPQLADVLVGAAARCQGSVSSLAFSTMIRR
jgi:hypothetical protein